MVVLRRQSSLRPVSTRRIGPNFEVGTEFSYQLTRYFDQGKRQFRHTQIIIDDQPLLRKIAAFSRRAGAPAYNQALLAAHQEISLRAQKASVRKLSQGLRSGSGATGGPRLQRPTAYLLRTLQQKNMAYAVQSRWGFGSTRALAFSRAGDYWYVQDVGYAGFVGKEAAGLFYNDLADWRAGRRGVKASASRRGQQPYARLTLRARGRGRPTRVRRTFVIRNPIQGYQYFQAARDEAATNLVKTYDKWFRKYKIPGSFSTAVAAAGVGTQRTIRYHVDPKAKH